MNYGAWVLLLNHVAKSPYTKPRSKITLHAVSGWASHRPVKAKKKKSMNLMEKGTPSMQDPNIKNLVPVKRSSRCVNRKKWVNQMYKRDLGSSRFEKPCKRRHI